MSLSRGWPGRDASALEAAAGMRWRQDRPCTCLHVVEVQFGEKATEERVLPAKNDKLVRAAGKAKRNHSVSTPRHRPAAIAVASNADHIRFRGQQLPRGAVDVVHPQIADAVSASRRIRFPSKQEQERRCRRRLRKCITVLVVLGFGSREFRRRRCTGGGRRRLQRHHRMAFPRRRPQHRLQCQRSRSSGNRRRR